MMKYFQGVVTRFGLAAMLVFAPIAAKAADIIQDIRIEGNQRIETATVLSYLELQKGDPFTSELLDRALKNLYATTLFADISLHQEGQALVVKLVENPIINEIRFEGNKKIKSEDLQSETQLRPRQVLTRTKVQADVDRLQEIYRFGGNFAVVIDPKIIRLDQNRVNLVFEISEGTETRIARIGFVGNTYFTDSQLDTVIRSREDRWYRFWSSDDKYDPDRLAYDRELLRMFYLERGYADFKVETAIAELSPDRKNFFVTFSVDEGERYRVGKVNIQSNISDLDAAPLKKTVTFESGEWYRASTIEETVTKMTNELGNMQYAFVDIRPGVARNREDHTVDINFVVNEGQRTFVENINIHGNSRTLDEVLRREMTLIEGDPFNNDKMKKSEQHIKDLGFFEKVEVTAEPGSEPSKTNIDIKVEEKSTGALSVGAGFSTTEGVLGDLSISERNFLGKGQFLRLSTTLSTERNEFDFSFTEPYFLKRDLSAGIDLFHVTRDLQEESSYDSRRSGGGLRLGYPLSKNWRQTLSYLYELNEISDVQPTASVYIRQQEGKRATSMISQGLTYDTRDSKLEPTEGFLWRLNTDLAGLGGRAQFYRVKTTGTYYYQFAPKWVGSILGEAGFVEGWGDETVRINERFYLGGDTLRGFDTSGIGPRDLASDDALGGNRFWRGSAELDFPTGLPEDLGLTAHAFTDVGSLWDLDESGATILDESTLRLSAGVGLSWRSPVGPVRFDFAQPIQKESFDELERFRFSFGTRF